MEWNAMRMYGQSRRGLVGDIIGIGSLLFLYLLPTILWIAFMLWLADMAFALPHCPVPVAGAGVDATACVTS